MAGAPEVKGTDAAGGTPARWRIAVVEDDEDLAFTLLYSLRKDGRFDPVRFGGGLLAPASLPDRSCTDCVTSNDTNTQALAASKPHFSPLPQLHLFPRLRATSLSSPIVMA